jgi:hypothetical protein
MTVQFVDRSIRLPSTPEQTRQCLSRDHDDWQMLDSERSTLSAVLSSLKAACAIEVGVYRAGSLGLLAANCAKVYALDIDPQCAAMYASRFPNVEFIIGPSAQTLPALIGRLQASDQPIDFVLIDADHSAAGVRGDVESVLCYRPTKRPLYVIMHDSFNPECRRGMKEAAWDANPHVHAVELDFVVGLLAGDDERPGYERSMWCGLGLAILFPEKRVGSLVVHERELAHFQAALRHSRYWSEKSWTARFSVPKAARRMRAQLGTLGRDHAAPLYFALKALCDRLRPRGV